MDIKSYSSSLSVQDFVFLKIQKNEWILNSLNIHNQHSWIFTVNIHEYSQPTFMNIHNQPSRIFTTNLHEYSQSTFMKIHEQNSWILTTNIMNIHNHHIWIFTTFISSLCVLISDSISSVYIVLRSLTLRSCSSFNDIISTRSWCNSSPLFFSRSSSFCKCILSTTLSCFFKSVI